MRVMMDAATALLLEGRIPKRRRRGGVRTAARPARQSRLTFSLPSPPESDQPAQLDDRLRVVVHAKVAHAVDAFRGPLRGAELLDDERSGLLPATIAAGSLTGFERRHHPLR